MHHICFGHVIPNRIHTIKELQLDARVRMHEGYIIFEVLLCVKHVLTEAKLTTKESGKFATSGNTITQCRSC